MSERESAGVVPFLEEEEVEGRPVSYKLEGGMCPTFLLAIFFSWREMWKYGIRNLFYHDLPS